jgi:phosphopantetheinyl transferase
MKAARPKSSRYEMTERVQKEGDVRRSESISHFFEASVQDLTPTDPYHDISVLFMPVRHDGPAADFFGSILSLSELSRAERFNAVDHKISFLQRRAFRRFCGAIALGDARPLSQVGFATTREGRPYLSELPRTWFSFSSCRHGYLAAWSFGSAVGVDIESLDQSVSPVEMAIYHFAPNESDAVCMAEVDERKRLFLRLWTLKEAGLKSIGEGVPYGLDAFQFETTPRARTSFAPAEYGGPNNFDARLLETAGCCAALVIRNRLAGRQQQSPAYANSTCS